MVFNILHILHIQHILVEYKLDILFEYGLDILVRNENNICTCWTRITFCFIHLNVLWSDYLNMDLNVNVNVNVNMNMNMKIMIERIEIFECSRINWTLFLLFEYKLVINVPLHWFWYYVALLCLECSSSFDNMKFINMQLWYCRVWSEY